MKNKAFWAVLICLVLVISILVSYNAQKSFLKIEVGLELLVQPEKSTNPGICHITEDNTNITVAKWPSVFHEETEWKLRDDFGEERKNPLTFVVYSYFNEGKKEITSFTFSDAGRYFGSVSFVVPEVSSGTYNLTLQILLLELPERQGVLTRELVIP